MTKPPAFSVDRYWLERLVMGSGRDECLDGMQRHLIRVIDGNAQPIGPEEKAAYAEYQRMKAAIPSPAGLVSSKEDADFNAAAMVLMRIPSSIWSNQLYCFVYTIGIMRLINLWDVMQYLESKPEGVRVALANHDETGELLRSLQLIYADNKNADESIKTSAKPPLEPQKRIGGTLKLKVKLVSRPTEVKDKEVCSKPVTHQYGGAASEKFSTDPTKESKGFARQIGDAAQRVTDASDEIQRLSEEQISDIGGAISGGGQSISKASRDGRTVVERFGDRLRNSIGEKAEEIFKARGLELKAGSIENSLITDAIYYQSIAPIGIIGNIATSAAEMIGVGVSAVGNTMHQHADKGGAIVAGMATGSAKIVGGLADAAGITEDHIHGAREKLKIAGLTLQKKREEYEQAVARNTLRKRKILMEYATLGGFLLADLVGRNVVPDNIQKAYAAAYPNESNLMDFREKVNSLSSGDELEGLLNGVKGKLFEIQYVDELNSGGLPDGWEAVLADSSTQSGWDLKILDENGVVQKLISAKSTEHVEYIQEALRRYPDIDVVTTSEVYAEMIGTPQGSYLIDGGINHVDLLGATQDAAAGNAGALEEGVLSFLALVPAAYHHFSQTDKPMTGRTKDFVHSITRLKVAALFGQVAMAAVPAWPVAILAAVGVSMIASVGNNKREQLTRIQTLSDQVLGKERAHHEKLLAFKANLYLR